MKIKLCFLIFLLLTKKFSIFTADNQNLNQNLFYKLLIEKYKKNKNLNQDQSASANVNKELFSDDIEVVRKAIKSGGNVNIFNPKKGFNGATPLMWALSKRNSGVARLLINSGAKVNVKDRLGDTPLMLAVSLEEPPDIRIIKFLLKKGARINAQNKSGTTALDRAVAYKHTKAAIALIKAGADVKLKDKQGKTVLDYLKLKSVPHFKGKNRIIKLLEEKIK